MSIHFAKVLTQFGQHIGMEELALDTRGQCSLQFDAMPMHILLIADVQKILCYCPLGHLHPETETSLIWDLLAANSFYQGTTGATLSWDRPSQQCHLSIFLDSETVTTQAFEQTVENLIQTAEQWAERIAQAAHTSNVRSDAPASVDTGLPFGWVDRMA